MINDYCTVYISFFTFTFIFIVIIVTKQCNKIDTILNKKIQI